MSVGKQIGGNQIRGLSGSGDQKMPTPFTDKPMGEVVLDQLHGSLDELRVRLCDLESRLQMVLSPAVAEGCIAGGIAPTPEPSTAPIIHGINQASSRVYGLTDHINRLIGAIGV